MMIQILDVAEADDLVEKNYARRAFRTTKQLSKETKTHTKDAFTVEETERLLSDLPDDLMGNSIRLMLISGVRLQELLALTPRDIAEDGSWVRVPLTAISAKRVQSYPGAGTSNVLILVYCKALKAAVGQAVHPACGLFI